MFKNIINQGKAKFNELKTEALKYKSKDFLNASLAGSALVAFADGCIESSEKQKMITFVENNESLSIYETSEVVKTFKGYIDTMEFDKDVGESKAYQALSKMRDKPEQARLILRMVIAIGSSDGNFDDDERRVALNIARELDVEPSDFDLG